MKQQFSGFWHLCKDTIVIPIAKSALYYFCFFLFMGFAVFVFLLIWGSAVTGLVSALSHIHSVP
ncbi:hypothetical protein [Dictyobacter formicarum]|uniref:Uncharacterized protein n=1 Tax=Dictyobacter formicarum TaxID=2778368 RepID=A0ABQ3VHP6_9CHLR|nr:hypothetical protein [Dictyobacter formicarum]GHO85348.1 hypothetical protein KSZ_33540 [Dictyobacter formicarum]